MNQPDYCTILWGLPAFSILPGTTVFSFLTPSQEHALRNDGNAEDVITMSRVMDAVSSEARELYLELVADIGLFTLPNGRTLRSAMCGKGKTSQWWYHPVAFRDSEGEQTYANILMILAIVHEAAKRNIEALRLVSPPPGVAEVLSSHFRVVVQSRRGHPSWPGILRSFLGRGWFLLRMLETKLALKWRRPPISVRLDVVLQGFWDWSVWSEEKNGNQQLRDLCFGRLPYELRQRSKRVGYWCWYDPWARPGKSHRGHQEILAPLRNRDDVLLFPSLLSLWEVITAVFNGLALWALLQVLRKPSFQRLFERQGLNFYPLFQLPLIQGAIGAAIPQCLLFERASCKAQQMTRPQHIVCFQEHFPQCRAMYAGVQGMGAQTWAIQHASYNQNKTFVALHPQKEFGEQQDGQSVPHPDRVCVMGELGERIFRECGYSPESVVSSGSTRYEQVVLSGNLSQSSFVVKAVGDKLNLLIVTSIPAKADFNLVEAAVLATESIKEKISLRLRQHPFGRMDRLPGYGAIACRLEVSDHTLETDLAWADLVLISHSTVGEEAVLAGKPVWQIRFPHPNQSALAEIFDIPRFYTVTDLRQALMGLISAPQLPRPKKDEVEQIYRILFQTTNKKPSVMIADAICAQSCS